MPAAAQQAVELSIGGMTCASCAARIEKKLSKLDGVTATVNFAMEKAAVSFPGTVSPDDLIAVVERTGYTATLPAPPPEPEADAGAAGPPADGDDQTAALRLRLMISLLLAVPLVVLLAMVPALQFPRPERGGQVNHDEADPGPGQYKLRAARGLCWIHTAFCAI